MEMQRLPDLDMDDRLLFYGCSLIHNQVKRSAEIYRLDPVYVVCVADYERPHTDSTDSDQFFFLELPRLKRRWDVLETNVERWCYLFGNLNNFAETPQNPAGFEDLFANARTGKLDGSELKHYVSSMLSDYEKYTIGEYFRREGKKENAREIAQNLKKMGDSIEKIAQATGLSPEEVSDL